MEESPFSTVAMQSESQQLSNSDYSTESPKSGSKKRKKKKKASGGQQAVSNGGEADQHGGEAPSSGESDAERLEAEEEGSEEPEAEGRADGDAGIQVSTKAPAGLRFPFDACSPHRADNLGCNAAFTGSTLTSDLRCLYTVFSLKDVHPCASCLYTRQGLSARTVAGNDCGAWRCRERRPGPAAALRSVQKWCQHEHQF